MRWDPFQREVLAELGHVLYRTAGSESIADELTAAMSQSSVSAASANANANAALLASLARAASMPADALPASWHDPQALARLRASGAAKRALWPRLRAMRTRPQ